MADMCFRCLNKTFGQIPVRRDANGIIRAQEAGVQTVLPTVLPELKKCLLFFISRQHQAMKLLANPAMISATSLGMRASGRCTGAHARAPFSAAACAAAAPGAGFAPPPFAAAGAAAAAALGPMLRMPAVDFGGLDGSMLRPRGRRLHLRPRRRLPVVWRRRWTGRTPCGARPASAVRLPCTICSCDSDFVNSQQELKTNTTHSTSHVLSLYHKKTTGGKDRAAEIPSSVTDSCKLQSSPVFGLSTFYIMLQ